MPVREIRGVTGGNFHSSASKRRERRTRDLWPASVDEYRRGVAAILNRSGARGDVLRAQGMPRRKPGSTFDMDEFRRGVAA